MIQDISLRAVGMGLLAAFVGYASSFAIVLAGLTASGANTSQAATGLFFATLGMGVCGVWLAVKTRTPAAVAWSTPGAAFLASSAALPGGFAEASGAFLCTAVLIIVTGFVPMLSRLVGAIPKPVASALLAGVLLNLCFAPALGLSSIPQFVVPVLAAWLLGLYWHKLAAMPCAVLVMVIILIFTNNPDTTLSTPNQWLPLLKPVAPTFTLSALVSISIPLYLVTMAGQNIPGFTQLELNSYKVNRPALLQRTGAISLLIAAFGSIPVNMSAITAALMCSEDAGEEPSKRYWAAITCGITYVILAFASGLIITFATEAPTGLITAVAGLALIPALVASISNAFSNTAQIEAPALTFLITASGMTLFGVSGAFWGIVAGVLVWLFKSVRLIKH